MRILLFLLSFIPFFLGVITAADAVNSSGLGAMAALGLAGDMFLIWAVLFTGAAIVDAIVNASKKTDKATANNTSLPATKAKPGSIAEKVIDEIEAGSIDSGLWDQAKENMGTNENAVLAEYTKLRIKRLSPKEDIPETAYPIK